MTIKEAWDLVKKQYPDFLPESALEFFDYYGFALRSKNSSHGVATGLEIAMIDKASGNITFRRPWDGTRNSVPIACYNPDTFEKEKSFLE